MTASQNSVVGGNIAVFYADDCEQDIAVMRAASQRTPIQVASVFPDRDTLLAGLRAAAERDILPGAAICDLYMPGQSLEAFLHAVRADPALADLSIVVMSDSQGETATALTGDTGPSWFVRKPVRLTDLENFLHDLAHRVQDD